MSGTFNPYRHQYEVIPASSAAVVLGNTGAVGDFLHRLVLNVTTGASAVWILFDGSTTVITNAGALPLGINNIEINAASQNGAWKVTTGAGITIIGIGTFTN